MKFGDDDSIKITKDIDWDMLKSIDTTAYQRDIDILRRKEMLMQEQKWDTGNYGNDQAVYIGNALNDNNNNSNPLVEMVLGFTVNSGRGVYGWLWDIDEEPWFDKGSDSKRSYAQAEMYISERRDNYNSRNPFEFGGYGVNGYMVFNIRGHGYGQALGNAWNWTRRTRDFIHHIQPLVQEMCGHEDIYLQIEYIKKPNQRFTTRQDEIYFTGVHLRAGDLLLLSNFRVGSEIEEKCHRIDHSVIFIRDKNLLLQDGRTPIFITNQNEIQFQFLWKENLKQLMMEESPTPEEMLMIEMAGYDKKEFWLDNVKSFDRLSIKQFDLTEATQCYHRNRPRFQL